MDQKKLLFRLKEFYALETYQVEIYVSQAKDIEEPHIRLAYERFAAREQEHVYFFEQVLASVDSEVPPVMETAFSAAGFMTGKALDLFTLKDRYKLGAAIEAKAVEMYHQWIKEARENEELAPLVTQLWYFLVDEESHQFWFKEHLFRLTTQHA